MLNVHGEVCMMHVSSNWGCIQMFNMLCVCNILIDTCPFLNKVEGLLLRDSYGTPLITSKAVN